MRVSDAYATGGCIGFMVGVMATAAAMWMGGA